MAELVVITPSRGRPAQLLALIEAVRDTTHGRAQVVACLDRDDPALLDYERTLPSTQVFVSDRRSLSEWTNYAAEILLGDQEPPRYLASLGDDHLPRSRGWDLELAGEIHKLGGSGIAYGNDLLQGEALPTAWVVSADIVRALGWMMLPTCQHMYVDAAILELGRALGRIAYRPDVVIEHLHPLARKARWDETYRATNTKIRYARDEAAFREWMCDGLAADVAKLTGVPV